MYNLNVNVNVGGASGSLLGVEGACTTPKTPEIVNSLMAMTNPFDAGYPSGGPSRPRIASVPPFGQQADSSCSSSASSCRSPLASPTSTPSVQHTCSQLIKEGLKLTIQTKRRATGGTPLLEENSGGPDRGAKSARRDGEEETAEDEERRRRRRERNKIAATKCRLKKRERTVNLVHESEVLETQNHDLKSQIQDLEAQRRRLMDMLSMHTPTCIKNSTNQAAGEGYVSNGDGVPQTYEAFIASSGAYHHHHQQQQQHQHHESDQHYGGYTGGYPSPGSGVDGGCMA